MKTTLVYTAFLKLYTGSTMAVNRVFRSRNRWKAFLGLYTGSIYYRAFMGLYTIGL